MTSGRTGSPTVRLVTIIDAEQLRGLVSMPDAIESSRRAFLADARGEVSSPLRSSMSRERALVMTAEHESGSAILKLLNVSGAPGDSRTNITGVVLWLDAAEGQVTVLVDGASLTALRTGAASGLATDLLAKPESVVMAMLGSGGQASDQIAAICAVRPIEEVRVHSRHLDRSRDLCRRLNQGSDGVVYRAVETSREAVHGADVICAATRAQSPLFEMRDLESHVHINAVGAFRPDMREVSTEVFGTARLVVIDQLAAIQAEAGDLVAALREGALLETDLVELGELLKSPRPLGQGHTVFKSVGIAAQDWAITDLVVRLARSAGLVPELDRISPSVAVSTGAPISATAR
ncbi:MAG: ornithine cyclodeaminase family protein [Candidatus Dormibacteria bacterium]